MSLKTQAQILDKYRRDYAHCPAVEDAIEEALELWARNADPPSIQEIRDLWREAEITTMARDIATDLDRTLPGGTGHWVVAAQRFCGFV